MDGNAAESQPAMPGTVPVTGPTAREPKRSGGRNSSASREPKSSAGKCDETSSGGNRPAMETKISSGKKFPKKSFSSATDRATSDGATTSSTSNHDVQNRLGRLEDQLAQVLQALSARANDHDHAVSTPGGEVYFEDTAQDVTDVTDMGQCPNVLTNDDNPEEGECTSETKIIPPIAAKFAIPTGIGEPVDDEIAQSTSYLMTHQLEEKVLEEAASKYPLPSNCPLLDTPKVNSTIWDNLTPSTRSRDVKLQRVQKSLTRGLNAFVHTLSSADLSDTQQDALALISNANFELNCLRKELIKPDINARYAHLSKPPTPVTGWLFGDDLGIQVKDLSDKHKAAAGVMRGQSRYHPYGGSAGPSRRQFQNAGWNRSSNLNRPSSRNAGRPFLGQRPQSQWRQRRPPPHTATRQMQHANQAQAQRRLTAVPKRK